MDFKKISKSFFFFWEIYKNEGTCKNIFEKKKIIKNVKHKDVNNPSRYIEWKNIKKKRLLKEKVLLIKKERKKFSQRG